MAKEENAVMEKPKPKMVIVETRLPGDGNNDVLRKLVLADTDPEDIPEGSTLLSIDETKGVLRKQTKPEMIRTGDRVRRREGKSTPEVSEEDQGYVDAILKRSVEGDDTVKFVRVKWEKSNQTLREDPRDLRRIW